MISMRKSKYQTILKQKAKIMKPLEAPKNPFLIDMKNVDIIDPDTVYSMPLPHHPKPMDVWYKNNLHPIGHISNMQSDGHKITSIITLHEVNQEIVKKIKEGAQRFHIGMDYMSSPEADYRKGIHPTAVTIDEAETFPIVEQIEKEIHQMLKYPSWVDKSEQAINNKDPIYQMIAIDCTRCRYRFRRHDLSTRSNINSQCELIIGENNIVPVYEMINGLNIETFYLQNNKELKVYLHENKLTKCNLFEEDPDLTKARLDAYNQAKIDPTEKGYKDPEKFKVNEYEILK